MVNFVEVIRRCELKIKLARVIEPIAGGEPSRLALQGVDIVPQDCGYLTPVVPGCVCLEAKRI